jgi:hypothetical protein
MELSQAQQSFLRALGSGCKVRRDRSLLYQQQDGDGWVDLVTPTRDEIRAMGPEEKGSGLHQGFISFVPPSNQADRTGVELTDKGREWLRLHPAE